MIGPTSSSSFWNAGKAFSTRKVSASLTTGRNLAPKSSICSLNASCAAAKRPLVLFASSSATPWNLPIPCAYRSLRVAPFSIGPIICASPRVDPLAAFPIADITVSRSSPVTAEMFIASSFALSNLVWLLKNREPTSRPARTLSSAIPNRCAALICSSIFGSSLSISKPRALSAAVVRIVDRSSSMAPLMAAAVNAATAPAAANAAPAIALNAVPATLLSLPIAPPTLPSGPVAASFALMTKFAERSAAISVDSLS